MDEAELIERCRAGDRAAFAELVAPSRERVWAVCVRITGNRHDAEDALQDALIAAWQNLGRFRGTAASGTWLYRIASNAALAVVRTRRGEVLDERLGANTSPGKRLSPRAWSTVMWSGELFSFSPNSFGLSSCCVSMRSSVTPRSQRTRAWVCRR
nr:sigma-70 family RNA polymerase sigma factor [Rhodococcus pyridinivorans]